MEARKMGGGQDKRRESKLSILDACGAGAIIRTRFSQNIQGSGTEGRRNAITII